MTTELTDKVALVTGGTRGIGFSIAKALVAEGARVFVCGRDPATLKVALQDLEQTGNGQAAGITVDVRHYADCRKLVRAAAQRFGGLDILVNNAGIGIFRPVHELTPEEWDATLETNLSGVFYCCREAVPFMRQRGGGYIFNISSLAGVNPFAAEAPITLPSSA